MVEDCGGLDQGTCLNHAPMGANRIEFWKSPGFNFTNRPQGLEVAAPVNDA